MKAKNRIFCVFCFRLLARRNALGLQRVLDREVGRIGKHRALDVGDVAVDRRRRRARGCNGR